MKMVCLPYFTGRVVQILSYIAVFVLDIIHFALTPITWLKFKAHLFMIILAGIGYGYLHFWEHNDRALVIAAGLFALVVLSIILIKGVRRGLKRLRNSLMRIAYSPVGVYFYIRPIFPRKIATDCKKLVECGISD